MSPRANVAQLKHALENGQKLIAAKELELTAYQDLSARSAAALERVQLGEFTATAQNLFQAWSVRAEVELEELQLTVRALEHQYKQATSMISLPGQN